MDQVPAVHDPSKMRRSSRATKTAALEFIHRITKKRTSPTTPPTDQSGSERGLPKRSRNMSPNPPKNTLVKMSPRQAKRSPKQLKVKQSQSPAKIKRSQSSSENQTPSPARANKSQWSSKRQKESLKPSNLNVNRVSPTNRPVEVKIEQVDRSRKYVGAHVSIAGGLSNSVERAIEIGAKAFALFLKSSHQWSAKPLTKKAAQEFKDKCIEHGFLPDLIVPHGSYLLNCGSPSKEILEKSREALLEELQRCEMLGLSLYNFHPGSSCGKITREKSIARIVKSINFALNGTSNVTVLIENMCGQGFTIGGKFEELKAIIDGVKLKSRIGVCLDTCHAFAAGYDLASQKGFEDMMQEFESVIGLNYLKAVHLNDSLGEVGSHLDRHANIGFGKIGTEGFRRIMNDKRFNGIPMVLETPPVTGYAEEIKILNDLKNS